MPNTLADVGDNIVLSTSGAERKSRYWDGRFVALNLIVLLLAAVAAYLEYSVYPSIMTGTYGEINPSLHLSVLTFTWDAVKCSQSCVTIPGLPALDFFQIFILIVILFNLSHLRRPKNAQPHLPFEKPLN